MDLLIKNSTVVTSTHAHKADILIGNGKIIAIEKNIDASPRRVLDASNRFIFPGGIDPHVHFHLPSPAGFSADDFYTGSKAAIFGGTTTFIDFVTPERGQSLVEALSLRIDEAKNSLIDHTFHVSPVEWQATTEQEINDCVNLGFTSFKVYMAYKASIGLNDDALKKVLNAVAKAGGMVTVHAEMGDEIEFLRNQLYNDGCTTPLYHALSRPPKTESDAVEHIIAMAETAKCPIYIVHVSTAKSLEHIQRAQKKGQKVYAETCPQYLLMNDTAYNGTFEATAKYVLSPPLRKQNDNDALWRSIDHGIVQTVGTDHCPFTQRQKEYGQDDFRKIPGGAGGVEHRLELLYTYGVLAQRITPSQLVDLTATQPARLFGLYPQKGEIAVGSDADLVIWNPDIKGKILAAHHHSNADINIYEGFKTVGIPETVLVNGEIALDNGRLNANRKGNLLKRYR